MERTIQYEKIPQVVNNPRPLMMGQADHLTVGNRHLQIRGRKVLSTRNHQHQLLPRNNGTEQI